VLSSGWSDLLFVLVCLMDSFVEWKQGAGSAAGRGRTELFAVTVSRGHKKAARSSSL
jgi:hypothetical protein